MGKRGERERRGYSGVREDDDAEDDDVDDASCHESDHVQDVRNVHRRTCFLSV